MPVDEKYFEENVLNLLDSFRGVEALESIDWQKLRRSFAQWKIKHGGCCAISNTALAPLLDAGNVAGQADLIRKCKDMDGQLYHSAISYMMGQAAVKNNTGNSTNDAIYVTGVSEEHVLLRNHLGGGRCKCQYLVYDENDKKKSYDLLEVVDENGEVRKIYFDVTDVMTLESLDNAYLSKHEKDDDIWSFLDGACDEKENPE